MWQHNLGNIDAFDSPDKVTIYKVELYQKSDSIFSFRPIQNKITLNTEEANLILNDIKSGIKKFENASIKVKFKCFNPRYGIEIEKKNLIFKYLVCFECNKILLIDKNEPEGNKEIGIYGSFELFDKLADKK